MKSILTQVIAKLMAVNYRLCFAKYWLRLGRFHEAVEPGSWFAFIVGAIFTPMVFGMNGLMLHGHPITVSDGIWLGVKGGMGCLALLYSLWEFVQLCKWLSRWAERYSRGYKSY